jgi:VanZ family protein
MGLIFIGSSLPARMLPRSPILSRDKLLHAAEYAALGALACRAALGRMRAGWAVLVGVLTASVFGASDELHQLLVPGRQCDVFDWIADTAGGAVGALGWIGFATWRGA